MSLATGARLGPYEVVAKLGEGGMGEVYRARDTKLDRDVALKILPESFASDPDRLMRFEREAKTLASLNHPNIAAIYGLEDRALVMELVEGQDLSEMIRSSEAGPSGPATTPGLKTRPPSGTSGIPLSDALPIARQIAEALEAAHEAGIIHRDLKPANIKVRSDGTVKVLDFGLAKAMDAPVGGRTFRSGNDAGSEDSASENNAATMTSPAMTAMGMVLGTAAYMSPEQARGKAVDRRADVWAFGAVFYEMLTGKRAFAGAEISDVLVSVLRDTPDYALLPADTPEPIRRLLRRCLEKDPRERLADMSVARIEIRDARESGPGEATSRHSVAAPPARRGATFAIAALATVSVILGALVIPGLVSPPVVDAPLVRFPVAGDPKLEIETQMTQPFAVSTDGRTIVFVADAGNGSRLWVRTVDAVEPRVLEDTVNGIQPAISPNGEWVAFVVANHLIRKIRLTGGPASTITSIDDVTAALTWLSDDEIAFEMIGTQSGIHRVKANSGTPELLVPIDGAAGETSQRRPLALRQDRRLVYASSTEGRTSTLAMVSLDGGARARLEVPGVQALGVIDGHLIYSRTDGALMAVPIDVAGMKTLGDPKELTDRVLRTGTGTSVAMSESGTLVFASAEVRTFRLFAVDATGKTAEIGTAVRAYQAPKFAPNGQSVAVEIAEGDYRDLWLVSRVSGELTRITRGARDNLVGWLPGGRALAHLRDGQIWTTPVDGSAESRKLVTVPGFVNAAAMAPDGKSVVVIRLNQGGLSGMFLVSIDSGKEVPLMAGATTSGRLPRPMGASVSPDGKWAAFEDRNEQQVHVLAIGGTATLQVSDRGGKAPMWGPDSRTLYYQAPDGLTAVGLQTTPALAVSSRDRVSTTSSFRRVRDIAEDGKTFLMLEPTNQGPIVFVAFNWVTEVRRQLRTQ